ncbi:hypothetical protein SGFS_048410 [Streptomyces graminofaciens]|jgi:hypothetical protein|uniref:Uncharacterized protein n=1 Tax=Streptomyces graminofaciens TaxID=68212 RepID=A0ABM8HKW2_9ACTN|nr:hypothetical protein [Streptomyces graminofaciens]BBC33547.1 hypothetical protein SGFS_048410 [Streptomyces graminofaciens]
MAAGGFCRLPDGNVVVALNLPGTTAPGSTERPAPSIARPVPRAADGPPPADDGTVRVLVLAANRARALTRLRNLGMRAIYLRGNAAPPTPDEITAVLHHPDGLIWRTSPPCRATTTTELWHPIRALLRRPTTRV